MKILVACEESQRVCNAFRKKGHEAYSCDIIPTSGNHPEWHIQKDVSEILNNRWDMIIAFPPCTDLCVSGARHFEKKRHNGTQRKSIEFFCKFLTTDCDKIAIENPVGIISGNYITEWFPDLAEKYNLPLKPTQIIQPYYFGEPHKKTTCLWLKGLKPLEPTNIVEPSLVTYKYSNGKITQYDEFMVKGFNGERGKTRSKTFQGVADAMAEQWG